MDGNSKMFLGIFSSPRVFLVRAVSNVTGADMFFVTWVMLKASNLVLGRVAAISEVLGLDVFEMCFQRLHIL